MKKHIMSGYGKRYLHIGDNGLLLDHEYDLIDIKTYCGKEFTTVQEAQSGNVFKSLVKGDPEACKTCVNLRNGYKDQRQMREWGKLKQQWA